MRIMLGVPCIEYEEDKVGMTAFMNNLAVLKEQDEYYLEMLDQNNKLMKLPLWQILEIIKEGEKDELN